VTDPHDPRTATAIDTLTEAPLDAGTAPNPVIATITGLPGHDDRLTDSSPYSHSGGAIADVSGCFSRQEHARVVT
jgi:hypothetical protein